MSENNNYNPNNSSGDQGYVPGSYSSNPSANPDTQNGQEQNNGIPNYNAQPGYTPIPPAYSNGYGGYQSQEKPAGHGMGVAALVLGIIAIITCWFGLGLIAGIVGLILGIIALVKLQKTPGSKKGMAITGTVLSGIGAVIGAVMAVVMIIFFNIGVEALEECGQYINNEAQYQQCIDEWTANTSRSIDA